MESIPNIINLNSPEWLEGFEERVQNRDKNYLVDFVNKNHPADVAEVLEKFEIEDSLFVYLLAKQKLQSDILIEFNDFYQGMILESLEISQITPIIKDLETNELTNILLRISDGKKEEILNSLNLKESTLLRKQLNFNENSAGRLMNTDFLYVNSNDSVRQGIIKIRKRAKESKDVYVAYVVNDDDTLVGYISLKNLFLSQLSMKVSKLMVPNIKSIHYNTDQEEIAKFFRKYNLISAPVVDDQNKIIGRITVDDVLDIFEEEASEDLLRLGGVSEEDRLTTSIWTSIKKRLVWLVVNLVAVSIASSVVSFFGGTIQKMIILASMMPVIANMGGNAAIQSITVMVRNIATGDISFSNWKTGFRKEFIIGLLNGFFIGFIAGLAIYLIEYNFILSVVTFLSLMLSFIVAAIAGALIPVFLKFLKIDPAIASSIFVTTFTDVFGFFCFLGLSSIFLF